MTLSRSIVFLIVFILRYLIAPAICNSVINMINMSASYSAMEMIDVLVLTQLRTNTAIFCVAL